MRSYEEADLFPGIMYDKDTIRIAFLIQLRGELSVSYRAEFFTEMLLSDLLDNQCEYELRKPRVRCSK